MDDEKAVFLSEGDILPWKIPLASNEVSLLHLDIYNGCLLYTSDAADE